MIDIDEGICRVRSVKKYRSGHCHQRCRKFSVRVGLSRSGGQETHDFSPGMQGNRLRRNEAVWRTGIFPVRIWCPQNGTRLRNHPFPKRTFRNGPDEDGNRIEVLVSGERCVLVPVPGQHPQQGRSHQARDGVRRRERQFSGDSTSI